MRTWTEEQKLIKEYKQKKADYDDIANRVGKYFMKKAKKLIKEGKGLEAFDLINICPDHVTNCFIVDAVNQTQTEVIK